MTSLNFQIPLSKGYSTTIDMVDADLSQFKWSAHTDVGGRVYAVRGAGRRGGGTIRLSRVIMQRILGRQLGSKELVDHVDNDPLNNTRANLRLATKSNNAQNSKRNKRNSSGYKGVYLNKRAQKWVASIYLNQKCIHLGYFGTAEDAHRAYCNAAANLFGEFARLE